VLKNNIIKTSSQPLSKREELVTPDFVALNLE